MLTGDWTDSLCTTGILRRRRNFVDPTRAWGNHVQGGDVADGLRDNSRHTEDDECLACRHKKLLGFFDDRGSMSAMPPAVVLACFSLLECLRFRTQASSPQGSCVCGELPEVPTVISMETVWLLLLISACS